MLAILILPYRLGITLEARDKYAGTQLVRGRESGMAGAADVSSYSATPAVQIPPQNRPGTEGGWRSLRGPTCAGVSSTDDVDVLISFSLEDSQGSRTGFTGFRRSESTTPLNR